MWNKAFVSARAGVSILLLAAIFSNSSLAAEPAPKLTEKQAVNLAEKFIADQGYTAIYPVLTQRVRDLLTLPGTIEALEANEHSLRHNTLEPNAYGVIRHGKDGPGWTVIFQYSMEARAEYSMPGSKKCNYQSAVGRAVTMNEFGHEIHVQHVVILLKAAQRKL